MSCCVARSSDLKPHVRKCVLRTAKCINSVLLYAEGDIIFLDFVPPQVVRVQPSSLLLSETGHNVYEAFLSTNGENTKSPSVPLYKGGSNIITNLSC